MDNNIFSTFNNNHLSDILVGSSVNNLFGGNNNLVGGNNNLFGGNNNLVGGNNNSFQYVIIIAIIILVVIFIYNSPYKKEIFGINATQTENIQLEQIMSIKKELQEIKNNMPPAPASTPTPTTPTTPAPASAPTPTPSTPSAPSTPPAPTLSVPLIPIAQCTSRGRVFDPIAVYDYRKLYDPLVDPRGRTSADEIPTLDVALQLNIPTQGFLDTYHRVGLLIGSDEPPRRGKKDLKTRNGTSLSISSDSSSLSSNSTYSHEGHGGIGGNGSISGNGILELIGKKMGHNWYKYFTSISIGNKIIKINVRNRNRRELYDDDKVYIPELSKWYKVKIDRMDMIDYSPYVL
jgi:hypothetical protein